MIQNKNRLEIRLDPDSQQLLDSLIVRTSLTKTSLIKKALIVYASALKNGHIYTVKLKGQAIKDEKTSIDDVKNEDKNDDWEKDYDKIIKELEKSRPKDD